MSAPVESPSVKIDSGFDPDNFSHLAAVEADSFWFNGRNRIIIWAIKNYFAQAVDFLEIGCGTGFVLTAISKEIPSLRLSGSELFFEGLSYASRRLPNANLFQLNALDIPFENNFDLIGAFDVLEHIEDDDRVLRQMYKAVRPGGGIILTVPQHMFLWSQSDTVAHHCRRYSLTELESKVRRAGFSIITHTSFVSLLLPLMFASRLRQKLFPSEYNVLSELRIKGVTGAILENVLKFELSMIVKGISFPCGGSLLMVAERRASK